MDRVHHQRGLDGHCRAIARIHPLDLARDQAVAHIVQPGAAIFGRDGRAEQAQGAHFAENAAIEIFVEIRLGDARQELVPGVGRGGVANHPLLVAELRVQTERVGPVETRRRC